MAKSEKRSGIFGIFSRKSTVSEKDLMTRESGPSDETDTGVLKTFSSKWFGIPQSKIEESKKPVKEAVDEAAAEVDETVAEVLNEGAEVPVDDVGGETEEAESKSLLGLLTKIGVPVAVAAAACAVLCKMLN